MKLLLTHRYFWPDTAPYALMLRSIGAALADEHEVHIFASRPSYRGARAAPARERLDGFEVRRCWVFAENRKNPVLRAANVAIYCLRLFAHILRSRPDVVTASTFPPVLAAWSASLAARLVGAQFIYHLQDIHPEVSQHSGGALGRGIPFKLLRWLDTQTLKRSTAIVTLSRDMARTLSARAEGLPVHVLNNPALENFGDATSPPAELIKPEGRRRILFAGNLGRFQNLALLTEGVAASLETHPDTELLLLGDGAALPELRARWGGHPQIKFGPFLPFGQAARLIAQADIGLVSLTPGIIQVAYPSKVSTYLGLGLPIFALVEPESALAHDLTTHGIGAVSAPTADAIARGITNMLDGPDLRPAVQAYACRYASEDYLASWAALINGLRPPQK